MSFALSTAIPFAKSTVPPHRYVENVSMPADEKDETNGHSPPAKAF